MHSLPGPSLLRRRPGGRFQTVLFHSFSRRLRSKPSLLVSYRGASPPCRFIAWLCISIPLGSTPRHLSSGHVRTLQFRLHSVACQLIAACADQCRSGSALYQSALFHANPYLGALPRLPSLPFRIVSNQVESSPLRVATSTRHSYPLPLRAIRVSAAQRRCHAQIVWSIQCPCGSVLLISAYPWYSALLPPITLPSSSSSSQT